MRPPWEELEPASRGAVERQRQAVRRIEQLATLACVAALALAAWATVEAIRNSVASGGGAAIWPTAGAGGLAGLIVLTAWLIHHLQFAYLTRSSGTLLLLHVLLVPSLLFVPSSTAVLVTAGLTRTAMPLVAVNVLLLDVVLLLAWRHAVKGGLLFGGDVPSRVVARVRLLLRTSVVAFTATAGLSYAHPISGMVALICLLVLQVAVVARGGYTLDVHSRALHPPGQ
jgi:uncharacterized membrane protein